eukprot:14410183-Ditylum_brightwellii.AAC.1
MSLGREGISSEIKYTSHFDLMFIPPKDGQQLTKVKLDQTWKLCSKHNTWVKYLPPKLKL